MITLLIILALPILYWISGFFSFLGGKPISPKNNRMHAWGAFGQIWGYIDGDTTRFIPYPMPLGFGPVARHLTYTKNVDDGKLTRPDEKSKDGKTIIYGDAITRLGFKKPIRVVEEEVYRLRKTEIHPYIVTVVMPKSGLTFYLNFTAKIKIIEPMDTLKLDEFLVFVGNEISDAVFPWGPKQEIDWLQKEGIDLDDTTKATEVVVDKMLGLNVDDAKCIIIIPAILDTNGNIVEGALNLLEYMNKKLEDYGMKILEFSLEIGYDKNVETILNARSTQQAQEEETKLQMRKATTRKIVRDREKEDADQLRNLDQLRLNEVTKPTMQEFGNMKAQINGSWKTGTTVFTGNGDGDSIEKALLAGILNNTKKVTDENQTTP